MGFGIVTSINGRAVIPETHPMTLGAFNAVPAVRELYGDVDLMIVAGGRMRGHETADLTLKLPERRVQIDIDIRPTPGSDAVYLAVALRFGSTLITLDREQRERVADALTARYTAEALAEIA